MTGESLRSLTIRVKIANPLQAWTGHEGSSSFRLQDSAHEGGKVVSRTHRPPLPTGNIPGIHFC